PPPRHRPRTRRRPPHRRGARRPHRGRRARGRGRALHRPLARRRMNARVLIVDDEERMAAVVAAALRRAGHECETSPGADAALSALDERGADVVVTDWRMPGMDGMELLRRIHARRPGLPVILLTAHRTVPAAV